MKPDARESKTVWAGGGNRSRAGEAPRIPDHELVRCIGRGGYGEVWLARNVIGVYRAVKIVYRERFDQDRPFERELKGLERFEPISRTDESQVDILHIGKNEQAGFFYYVMELADDLERGRDIDAARYVPRTLRSEIARRRRIGAGECIRIGRSLSAALGHLHRNGLVHRDVKPSNVVFIGGRPKLADIGLVAETEETKSFVGTEGFLPPEGPGTPQADLYALGKVLYEMATGLDRKAFPELPSDLREWPERDAFLELNEVIVRACHDSPRERYASAEEMDLELGLLEGGKSVSKIRAQQRRYARLKPAGALILVLLMIAALVVYGMSRNSMRAVRQAVRLHTVEGQVPFETGDLAAAMVGFSEALRLAEADPVASFSHRFRVEAIWRGCPKYSQLLQHRGGLTRAHFAMDEKVIWAVTEDGSARIWDVKTGKSVQEAPRNDSRVNEVNFTSDGRKMVTASEDGVARLWGIGGVSGTRWVLRQGGPVTTAEFSPDGERLATGSRDGTVCFWSTSTGAEIARRLKHNGPVWRVRFDRTGAFLATGTGTMLRGERRGEVRIYEVATGHVVFSEPAHTGPILEMVSSPDGRSFISAGEDGTVRVWDWGGAHPSRWW